MTGKTTDTVRRWHAGARLVSAQQATAKELDDKIVEEILKAAGLEELN